MAIHVLFSRNANRIVCVCRTTKRGGCVATSVTLKRSDKGTMILRCDKRLFVFSCAVRAFGLLLAMAEQLGIVRAIPARKGIATHFLSTLRMTSGDHGDS